MTISGIADQTARWLLDLATYWDCTPSEAADRVLDALNQPPPTPGDNPMDRPSLTGNFEQDRAGRGAPTETDAPLRTTSPTHEALSDLHTAISYLDQSMDRLADRLGPVSSDADPPIEGQFAVAAAPGGRSPLRQQIDGAADRVTATQERIDLLIARLDV